MYDVSLFLIQIWGGAVQKRRNPVQVHRVTKLWMEPCQGGVKVNFLARCGQKSDLSGLCGIGYWVWIISTAHCKQPILVGY